MTLHSYTTSNKYLKIKRNSNTLPPFVPALKVIIGFEGSGKWPDDVEAIKRVKTPFLIKIAELVTSKYSLVAVPFPTYTDIIKIDRKINAKIQSVRFENFPIYSAHFSTDGSEIIVGSNKFGHFFTYDMLSGKILRIHWDKGFVCMWSPNVERPLARILCDVNPIRSIAIDSKGLFKKVVGEPVWADFNRKPDSDDDSSDELLQKTGNFIQHSEALPKGLIRLQKCQSLVDDNLSSTIVKSAEFHPTSRVAVVAATNGTANLFQIDGKINAKIQSVHFENFPIYSAHFSTDGSEIIIGSNKFGHFFTYDILSGKILRIHWDKGFVCMWSPNVERPLARILCDVNPVRSIAIDSKGLYLATASMNRNLKIYDVRAYKCLQSYKLGAAAGFLDFSQMGLLAVGLGNVVESEKGFLAWLDVSIGKMVKETDTNAGRLNVMCQNPYNAVIATGPSSAWTNL